MAKNRKLKQAKSAKQLKAEESLLQPKAAPFFNSRNSVILSIAFLTFLWFIQFYTVLVGNGHFWEDVVLQDFPVRIFARSAFYQLEFPHWNPFAFSGTLFFASQVPGVLYPFNILISLIPVSDEAFWRLIQTNIALHILIAGISMFVYLRFKKRSDTASLFGAIAFMFGGFLITHLIHTMMVYILAWFPLILMFLEKAIAGLKLRHALSGGLLLGLTMLAGHPQLTFYQFLFMFAICAFLLFQNGRKNILKGAAAATVFFAVAAGLSLVQYIPALEFGGLTFRDEYTVKDASEGSLQFVQLITAFMPKVFGAYTGNMQIPPFWLEDSFRHGYYNYWETCFYFGVSTLILSCFWFRRIKTHRTVKFAALWILGSLCIALGGNFFVFRVLFSLGIPGFTSFRVPARILFTWGILFPLMAAAVLDSLNDLKSKKLKIISLSLCFCAAVLGIFTAAGGLGGFFPLMNAVESRAAYASSQGAVLLFNAASLSIVLILFFKDIIKLRTAKVLIIFCLAIDMLIFAAGHHIVPGGGAPQEFSKAKSIVDEIKAQQSKEIFRFNSRQYIVEPGNPITRQNSRIININQGTVSKIQVTEGYTPLRLKHFMPPLNGENFNTMLDLLNVKHYANPHFRMGDQDLWLLNETYLPRAKLFYKTKFIRGGDSDILAYMNSPGYDHHNEVVLSTDVCYKADCSSLERYGKGNGKAQITDYKFNKIEIDVESDREAILWLSEIWYPAWKATVNGKKTDVFKANYSFRAVVVPEGKSKVVFKFNSVYFNIGALISFLTLIVSLTILTAGSSIKKMFTKKVTGTDENNIQKSDAEIKA